jgi:hypothetical protein
MAVFWDVASCSLVEIGRRFKGAYCLPLNRQTISTRLHGATSQKTVIFNCTAVNLLPSLASPYRLKHLNGSRNRLFQNCLFFIIIIIIIIIIIYSLFNDTFQCLRLYSVDVGGKPAAPAQFLLNPDSSARAI